MLAAACAPIPALTFVSGGDDAGVRPSMDATLPDPDAGAAAPDPDGGSEDAVPTDPGTDDAGPDVVIQCGDAGVADCASCPGSPLRCHKGGRDQCVADCTVCAAGYFPCLHCPTPDAAPRGTCVPYNAHGVVGCTTGNLCACSAPTDCLAVSGAAETCDMENGKERCLTCGSPTTADAACVSATGAAGQCVISDGAPPACE
jgi:hypothetical protein